MPAGMQLADVLLSAHAVTFGGAAADDKGEAAKYAAAFLEACETCHCGAPVEGHGTGDGGHGPVPFEELVAGGIGIVRTASIQAVRLGSEAIGISWRVRPEGTYERNRAHSW